MDTQFISVVISYVIGGASLILICCILMKEMKRICCLENKGDIWLNIWSTSTIVSYASCIIFGLLHKTAYICTKTYEFGSIMWVTSLYTITLFQTRRLQYTFNTRFKSTCVESLGYSQKLFYILYFYGTVAVLSSITYLSKYAYNVRDHGLLGCQILFKRSFHIIAPILLGILLIWDWTLLGLYLNKFYHLTRNKIQDDNVMKASYFLRKILFLTFIFEISSIINLITFRFSENQCVSTAIHQSDNLISIVVIFLMIQSNDDWYRRFVCSCLFKLLLVEQTKHLKDFQSVSPKEINDENHDEECGDGTTFPFDQATESLDVLYPLSTVIETDGNIVNSEQMNISSSNTKSKSPKTATMTCTESSSTKSQNQGVSVSFLHSHISKTGDHLV